MFRKLIDPLVACTTFAAGLVATAGQALADEPIVTKAPAAALSTTSSACTGVWGFFVTDCPLSWYGVRFYGTIDTGGGYQTHGAPLDPNFAQGSSYLVQKMNRQPMWTLAPGALSTSTVGVLVDERFAPGWAFIGQLEASFDPYSLELSNSPYSIASNRGVPLNLQTANNDSSRAGQFYNSVGYIGINSDTFGTLTFFRQNALSLDAITAYDPMGGSYAFSALGFPARIAALVTQKLAALPRRSNTESTSGRYARRSLKSVAIIKTMAQTGITKAKSAVIYRSATSARALAHFHSTRSTNGRKTRQTSRLRAFLPTLTVFRLRRICHKR